MKLPIFVMLVAMVSVFESSAKNDSLINVIQKIGDAADKAYLDGDMDKLWSKYSDDVIQMPNYKTIVQGKKLAIAKEIEARSQEGKVVNLKHKILDVWGCDELLIEIGHYKMAYVVPNVPNPIEDAGKYITIYKVMKDGSYKVKLEIWNGDTNPYAEMDNK